jgi:DNA-binding PadR family transcriptional regulator
MTALATEPITGKLNKDKAHTILAALDEQGPMTADEFITRRGLYVNSWAPTFTALRKHGLVARNGEKRATTHGSEAYVIEITDDGRRLLRWAVGEDVLPTPTTAPTATD